jgi:ssDNA-binding Zn-finger/Zn-ribbon topoisomerase 1
MTNQDRRSIERCPVCQGPAVSDESKPGGLRCRNSACKHNHANIAHATFKNDAWQYTCADCENRWTAPKA